MSDPVSARRRRIWLSLVLVLVIALALEWGGLVAVNRMMSARIGDELQTMRDEVTVAARILQESFVRVQAQAAALHGLARLVSEGRRTGDAAMADRAFREAITWRDRAAADVFQVAAIAADGYLDWTTLDPPPGRVYLGDREHFSRIASGERRTFVSETLQGRVSGRATMQFTEAMARSDGAFDGVTVVSMDPRLLWRPPDIPGMNPADVLTVLRRDGTILARNPALAQPAVLPISGAAARIAPGETGDAVEATSPIDGRRRIVAFRSVPGSDLIVMAGLDMRSRLDRLAPEIDRIRLGAAFTMALIAVLALGSGLMLHWRRRITTADEQSRVLRESEAMFRQMAESLPDLVRLQDADGNVIYASPASREIIGVEPEALLGRLTGIYVHPDDMHLLATRTMKNVVPGTQGFSEVRLVRPDGRIVWVRTNVRVIASDPTDRRTIRIVSVTRDVTRQRAQQAALRHATEEVDAALRATSSALFRVRLEPDGQLRLQFASDSLVDVIGFTPQEAMDAPEVLASRRDPAFRAVMEAYFNDLMTAGTSMAKYRFQHKDGRWLWLSIWANRTADTDYPTAVGLLTDITRQQQAEMDLTQTSKLATLGQMSTSIAHELNQPLAVIGMTADGVIEMLKHDTLVPAVLAERMERIAGQVQRAASIVRHMRMFGRKPHGAPAIVPVARAIEGALAIVAPQSQREAVRITADIAPDLPPVRGHLVLIEQVLVNLIDNALHAIMVHDPPIPSARRRIEVAAMPDPIGLAITVTDHAGGIAEDAIQRVFEPFFTTNPLGTGTGLGLSISSGIVTDMGGQISAANQGDGAVLTVRLPRAAEPGDQAPAGAPAGAPDAVGAAK